jgi:hypothetical protein
MRAARAARGGGTTLHADESGQISALAVLAAAIFASLLMLVVNTGFSTGGKIEMQNAADATAISGATWIARGLNLVSLNNVTQTQLLALYLLVPSLQTATQHAQVVLDIELGVCAATGPFAGICLPALEFQKAALNFFEAGVEIVASSTDRGRVFWDLAVSIGEMSRGIVAGFPALAEGAGARIAAQNGAEFGFIVPAAASNFTFQLPARRGALRSDLCEPTRYGSPRRDRRGYTPLYSYPLGEGPLEHYADEIRPALIPFITTGITAFFSAFREANYRELCGGSGVQPTFERPVKTLAECRAAGGGAAQWLVSRLETTLLPERQAGIINIEPDDERLARAVVPSRYETSCSWSAPGTPVGPGVYRTATEYPELIGGEDGGYPVVHYRYVVLEYRFVRGSVTTNASRGAMGGTVPEGSGDPVPYLLGSRAGSDAEVRSELHYLAVVYRSRRQAAAPNYFVSPAGTHRLAYAQARVYNPTAFDLFTQDWRVTLEPASMIEDPAVMNVLGSPGAGPAAGLGAAGSIFSVLGGQASVVRLLNNH